MKLKVKLDEGARMPTRAHDLDAGLDLYSREKRLIYVGGGVVFDTGVHIALEPGTYGKIESKSGLNVNHDVVSCGGIIDAGYTGSIKVKLYNLSNRYTEPYVVEKGDKIAQLIIQRHETPELVEADELDTTERGDKGFGSSGK